MSKKKQPNETTIGKSIDDIFSNIELVKEKPKQEETSFLVAYNPAIVSLKWYCEWLQFHQNALKNLKKEKDTP